MERERWSWPLWTDETDGVIEVLRNRHLLLPVALLLGAQVLIGPASAQIPSSGAVSQHNIHSEGNAANLGGNAMDYFERRLPDGTFKRYAVAATHGNGFDIVDVTDPLSPSHVTSYATPGLNYHPWVQVNGPRNIVAISIEEPADNLPNGSVAHGGSNGIEFVDISDLTKPVQLSLVPEIPGCSSLGPLPARCSRLGASSALRGPHTIRMIGPNHIYTTLPTFIIDYTDPTAPVNLEQKSVPGMGLLCGHEFAPDQNIPGRTYVGICGNVGKWAILDTSDPANPQLIHEERDLRVEYAHEVFPAPDSSFVGVGDFRTGNAGGQSYTRCPGGGIHFYDISGKYIPGASVTSPQKMGAWFAPFTGAAELAPIPATTNPNWGPCNLHSLQFHPERLMVVVGLYMGGSWVLDPTAATAPGGEYQEYSESPNPGLGPTTWGNTKGNFVAEGDMVNAAQWLPFDIPIAKDHYYTNGLFRGLDILHYEAAVPKKISRLRIDASATGGVVSGVLDRYAVLTHEGWVNKPLGGKTVEIRSGGTTLLTITAADGSFSANLGLSGGSHEVTVTWAGDDDFGTSSLTRQVSA